MVYAVVGAGGKTTKIHELAETYRKQGKTVFVTTSTHMYIEPDTLLTDDAEEILRVLEEKGYVMAGRPAGEKITALSKETYETVCRHADIVLTEADGSRQMPLKYPNETEPVIYENVDRILVICGLQALGKSAKEAVFRRELAPESMKLTETTRITPEHIQELVRKGYTERMKELYADKKIVVEPNSDGSLYQRAVAGLLRDDMDVSLLKKEWFEKKPCLFICGGGHVAKELAEFADKLDFRVCIMDDREEFANENRFPMAEEIICDSFENLSDHLREDSFYVVVTRGHQSDFTCLKQIIRTRYRYLGMIGSRMKVEKTFHLLEDELSKENLSGDLIRTIHAPIGLPIGAVTPGEIAISILAEIIQEKNRQSTSSASEELLESKKTGVLCIIIEKTGSSPRGTGSMMLVCEDQVIDSIGGGTVEAAAILDAKHIEHAEIREYHLNNKDSQRLGMICGGSNKVLFIPV